MKKNTAYLLAAALGSQVLATSATLVLNPSFEANYNDAFPHYGPIDSWIGGSGVNEAAGPFHNGPTPIPDRARVGFSQGSTTLAQDIAGLEPGKQYWIQFWYDTRNCCGGTIDIGTFFNDTEFDHIGNVRPAMLADKPYYARSVPFTPDADFGLLLFRTTASGDATATFDAVTIVQRDTNNVVVMNPSFEASGQATLPGEEFLIAGWTGAGVTGVDDASTGRADNGTIPDQSFAAFIEGPGSLSQTIPNLAIGKTYQVTLAYNAKNGTSPHLQLKAGETVLFEEDVAAVGGALPYRTRTASFTATDLAAVLTVAQTKESAEVLLIDDLRIVGETQRPLPPLGIAPNAAELAPGQKVTVTITVPTELLAIKDATLTFRSPNTNILKVLGANDEGILSLAFAKGGPNVKTIELEAVGRGIARLELPDTAGLEVPNDLSVSVVTSFVRNPSFESGPAPGGVGYGAILAWNTPPAGVGLNTAAGPFHDNGLVPDRDRVAFIQNSGVISQEILGLAPGKTYALQFWYNVRNCCGGTMDLQVRFDGAVLTNLAAIAPVTEQNSYYFQELALAPSKSSGLLEFAATAAGDASLLLDAVSIAERPANSIRIANPSFEASGSPVSVGYVAGNLAGWTATGGHGINVNGAGPFTDNGLSSDQDRVAFLQGPSDLSQTLSGFEPGQEYTLIFDVNGRSCCGPEPTAYRVSLDDAPLLEEEISPVGGQNPFPARYLSFTPATADSVLKFAHTSPAGDHTLLIDNVRVLKGKIVETPRLRVARDGASLRLLWPASAAGFTLQASGALPGGWAAVGAAPVAEGNDNVVTETIGTGPKYYRLAAP